MATPSPPKRIVFFHPDLGIGGAERLIVDAAVGLQELGYQVTIFTSHRDTSHCFDEARDGTLDVRVRGNTLIPSSLSLPFVPFLSNRFAILCAILRQLHLILQITLFTSEFCNLKPSYVFVDQLSAGIPLLKLLCPSLPVLFYCHFPDKLLVQDEGRGKDRGWTKAAFKTAKGLYRIPFDALECWSTAMADRVLVNSEFTKGVFREAFPELAGVEVRVVYPCVRIPDDNDKCDEDLERKSSETEKVREKEWWEDNHAKVPWKGTKIILSINRFEEKKDIGLAIRAFARLEERYRDNARLIIAGGYDPHHPPNVTYHQSLLTLCKRLSLSSTTVSFHSTSDPVTPGLPTTTPSTPILFLLSIPTPLKYTLLRRADLLVYTPRNEHFGIVPLEAMAAGTPVLAATEGGPRESVVEGQTGWLRDVADVEGWSGVMRMVVSGDLTGEEEENDGRLGLEEMGWMGRRRVKERFSREEMAGRLKAELEGLDGPESEGEGVAGSEDRAVVDVSGVGVMAVGGAGLVIAFGVAVFAIVYGLVL